jgi:hypothetical protein
MDEAKVSQGVLADVRRDRAAMKQQRDNMPGAKLASIMAKQGAIAAARPPPGPAPAPELTELERLRKDGPQSSAQVIGHHKMPDPVPDDATANARRKDELEALRAIFPNSTTREVGFHRNFRDGRAADVRDAEGTLRGITADQLKADPALADAVAYMRSRVIQLNARPIRPRHG